MKIESRFQNNMRLRMKPQPQPLCDRMLKADTAHECGSKYSQCFESFLLF